MKVRIGDEGGRFVIYLVGNHKDNEEIGSLRSIGSGGMGEARLH